MANLNKTAGEINTIFTHSRIGDDTYKSVFFGLKSLGGFLVGNSNTAFGWESMININNASYNTSIGRHSLFAALTGDGNSAIGSDAMGFMGGNYNTCVGFSAGHGVENSSGVGSVYIGKAAGNNLGAVNYNTIIGYHAGYGVAGSYSSEYDVFIGANIATVYEGGLGKNTIIGSSAGRDLTTGNNNVIIGYQAGYLLANGSNNIVIGNGINLPAINTSNTLKIGSYITGDLLNGDFTLGEVTRIGTKNLFAASGNFSTANGAQSLTVNTTDWIIGTSGSQFSIGFSGTSGDVYCKLQMVDVGGNSNANVSMQAAGGNVLIGTNTDTGQRLQVNGTAKVSGSLTTNGGLQTFGANDSGGAGYRVVLVPNA